MTIDIYKDWLDEANDVAVGETHRHNHTNCPAGEDTRARLYLSRPINSPNIVLAFCHNCGEHGVYKNRGSYYDYWDHKVDVNPRKEFYVPSKMIKKLSLWPTEAKQWAMKNRLTEDMRSSYFIQYDPSSHGIFLPITKKLTKYPPLIGYQIRPLGPQVGAKYVTHLKNTESEYYTFMQVDETKPIVLVEDYISGVHVACAGFNALVNYGTIVKPTVLNMHCSDMHNVVWLDNDSPTVNRKAEEMVNLWAMLHPDIITTKVDTYLDPKHYTKDEIRRVINGGD